MAFYIPAPVAETDAYIALALAHNTEQDYATRDHLNTEAMGILNMVRERFGNIAAGEIICAADIAAGCMIHDRPMCGGFFLEVPNG